MLIGLVVAALPAATVAQTTEQANRNAYHYAVRCFAAAPFARERGMTRDDGRRAYDLAQRLGASLGYSQRQAHDDINARTTTELATMVRDRAYLDRVLSDCRRLGLL